MKVAAKTFRFVLPVLAASVLALAACGGSSTPTPAPTATSEPATATPEPATATPEAVATTEAVTSTESTTSTGTTTSTETAPATGVVTTTEVTTSTTNITMTGAVTSSESVTGTESVTGAETTTPTSATTTGTTSITSTTPVSGTTEVSGSGQTYSDPFAYCAAVGNVDAPTSAYTGDPLPDSILTGLQTAMKTDMPLDVLKQGTVWRCMDSQVYACNVGANLPCSDKANTDKTPSEALNQYCADAANTNADSIPMVVTGHNTVYSWRCTDGKPVIVDQIAQVDAQGFVASIWYPIPAP